MAPAKQVFISYDQQDIQFAQRLAEDLQQLGVKVWIAPVSICPGENWVDAINRGLLESSHMVAVLTPSAIKSDWVNMETNAAIALERKGQIQMIPLEVESCEPPPLWSSYQMIPFRHDYEAGFSQLFAILKLRSVTHKQPGSNEQRTLTPSQEMVRIRTNLAENWIEEAENARAAKTLTPGAQPPTSLVDARNQFEGAWKKASLSEREELNPEIVSKALSYLNRLYRVLENDSSIQPNANYWADEAIRYFEEIQDSTFLTEALLDKAAIYLDIAQLGHNDKLQFESMAREGDAIMTHAYQTADETQRPVVLRISSRFYYNLARPNSFRLSENWDNNYLLLAYEKAQIAYDMAPTDSKNANQLARTVIKVSKNPPQDSDSGWTQRLRASQKNLKNSWLTSQSKLVGLNQRLSPLNVLGVSTLETIAREWNELDTINRKTKALNYAAEIDTDALSPLREAAALLQNSELRKAYGFDLYYDITRAQAIKTAIIRTTAPQRAVMEFEELKGNLLTAKENAKTSQLEAAIRDINNEITFKLLTSSEKTALLDLLSVGVK